eukprot:1158675-Amphidinium_carterae.3
MDYAIVKRPPHKSWIMHPHSDHGASVVKIGKLHHSIVMDGFVQIIKSQIKECIIAGRVTQYTVPTRIITY